MPQQEISKREKMRPINIKLVNELHEGKVCMVYPLDNPEPESLKQFKQLLGDIPIPNTFRYFFYEEGWLRCHPYKPNGIKLIPLKEFFIQDSCYMINKLFPEIKETDSPFIDEYVKHFSKGDLLKANPAIAGIVHNEKKAISRLLGCKLSVDEEQVDIIELINSVLEQRNNQREQKIKDDYYFNLRR